LYNGYSRRWRKGEWHWKPVSEYNNLKLPNLKVIGTSRYNMLKGLQLQWSYHPGLLQ
jgi:hypothetical protein